MKKVLFASTALVAAGLMITGTASASEKIKLELGGFSKWWVVGQFQDDNYLRANNRDFNNVDIKGDNEIHFGGSTKLDNGMVVGVQTTLGSGGHTDNTIDQSYAFVETGYGKVIIGNHDNGTKLLHVSAPDAAGNKGSDGILTGGFAVQTPDNFVALSETAIGTDGVAEKITYVAPTFMGLTLGASYIPNATAHNRGLVDITNTIGEIYGVGGLYANTFGDVDLKLSGGWVTYNAATGINNTGITGDGDVNEYSVGTALSMGGFTLGGSYRHVDGYRRHTTDLQDTSDAQAWDVGVQYATGPYAVSLMYMQTETVGTVTTVGDDKMTLIQASGSYNLGAGVDLLATVGHVDYDDETVTAANNNKGWAVMTGLGLSF